MKRQKWQVPEQPSVSGQRQAKQHDSADRQTHHAQENESDPDSFSHCWILPAVVSGLVYQLRSDLCM